MKKLFKILGISLASVIALLVIIPYLIPQTITKEITQVINKNIKGEVKFESTSISFFNHFPSLTLNLNQFLLKGSAPFEKDTLIYTKKLALGINLLSLFSNQIKVDEFYLDDAHINILTDEKGHANYNVYESKAENKTPKSEGGTAIKIEGIFINHSNLTYSDKSIPMLIRTNDLNYTGKGDLSNAIFDLKSTLSIKEMDVLYANTPYLLKKKINAKLITKVNTNSLNLIFDENNLKINSLPIEFVGHFTFLKDGYDIDFRTRAKETDLHNIFTALPPAIAERLERTNIKGYAEIDASLIGKYIAATHEMPTASFNMKIRDGYISNPNAPEPISNLFLNLKTKVPGLNTDSLNVNMDSLYFNIGKDYVASVTKIKGFTTPEIYSDTRSNIDLEKWAKVINLDSLALKGRLNINFKADGKYTKKIVRSGIRQVDTVIATVPKFSLKASLNNGYFKYLAMPAAIDKINFEVNGSNTDGDYKSTKISIDNIDIKSLNNFIKGYAKLQTAENMPFEAQLKSVINFGDLKNIYPINSYELSGLLNLDLQSKGPFNKAKKLFPVTTAAIKLNNGRIKTASFDQPLEKIQIDADLVNTDGTLRSTKLNIRPIAFEMAGQPFTLKAEVNNFDNITYNVSTKGLVDIGKIYQLFAVKGYQVKGIIATNASFKGSQSDAMNGRYGRLQNNGTLTIKQLNLQSDLFPKTFFIHNGIFSFHQDKMRFDEFNASYGASDFKLNGNLSNVINYILNDKAKLTGTFTLKSNKIYADEFMVNADHALPSSSSSKGVILIPDNLNVTFSANANDVFYNGLNIKNAKGTLLMSNATLALKQTGFTIAGAEVGMDANYKSLNTQSGLFDFHLTAKEFDIARAYKEIKLFREMASSASKVKGVVGLDYQLSGKLNDEMFPVFPSLKGGGVLSLKKVSLMGFKMMNAVSKETKRDSLTNPNLSDVQVKSTIKNNIITIEQTKMKVAGFRPRFEGQVSFDGRLNMSGRLGLPPFGLFGIPLSITGTQEKPIVKLKRNKEGKLEETTDGK
ncbi:AsmA-like C-terminal region-containing protein [Pedobacter aquatilis]|uniref:AsmA family protein n=1 Tax=Pedobacter aquatilis TaxID=351343 RepID=UPI002931A7E4|nr:AsmA-like C-terminal region-containing protein [Pedobacter aquatilis]